MRSGRLLRAEPRRSTIRRPASRSRATSFPSDRIDPVARNILTQLYPEPNTAGTRQANGQTINNYLLNPIKQRAGQPVRRQGRPQPDRRTTASSCATAIRRPTGSSRPRLPHGDAGATFGAGDGNIKAQSLAFNDTHTLRPNLLNEFRFGWTSIKFFMTSRSTTAPTRPRPSGFPASTSTR